MPTPMGGFLCLLLRPHVKRHWFKCFQEDESSDYDDDDDETEDEDDEDDEEEELEKSNNIIPAVFEENNDNINNIMKNNSNQTEDVTNANSKSAHSSEGVLVDLLETEVDSLKSKLELTQNELFSLHNSNLDLTTQLRQTQAQIQCSTSSSSNKKYSFTTANSSQNTSVSSTSSANGTKSSPMYDRNSYVAEELARTQKELGKQTSEIMALKNQLSINQVITFKINLQINFARSKQKIFMILANLQKTCTVHCLVPT